MCQRIIQFCSGSTKPLVFAGSFLTLLLAIGLGYLACCANSLYQDIDPSLAQSRSLVYLLQLVASVYLILISVLAYFAAHYDEKHSIRALAILTSLNFFLAVAAIVMIPSGNPTELESQFKGRLMDAMGKYNYTQKPVALPSGALSSALVSLNLANSSLSAANQNISSAGGKAPDKQEIQKRMAVPDGSDSPLDSANATKLWDDLQNRGCCGFVNSTDWETTGSTKKLPKSCCSTPEEDTDKSLFFCRSVDKQHELACIAVIGSTGFNTMNMSLLLVLALIALLNLYLANVTGFSAYRTFHYDEASQNAYS